MHLFNRIAKSQLFRTVGFKPLAEFIGKTVSSFVAKTRENPTLLLEAFFTKTNGDVRRIQYGEYEAQDSSDAFHMDLPTDLHQRCRMLETHVMSIYRQRYGGMFVKWVENVLTTMLRESEDRYEEFLEQFGTYEANN